MKWVHAGILAGLMALPGAAQSAGAAQATVPATPGTAGQATAPQTAPAQQQPAVPQNLLPGANSPAESAALAYMRTVMRSEFLYKKKHNEYPKTLAGLVGSGSMTKRLARPDRGDYTVRYKSDGEKYELSMIPKTFDDQHRSFFADDDGKIRVAEQSAATAESPVLKTKR